MTTVSSRTSLPLLTLQFWSPDTCKCQVHQGLEESVYDWLPDETGELKQVERPFLDADGNPRPKLTVYLTRAQAVDLHTARFIRGPGNTVRWRRFYLFRYLPLSWRRALRPLFHFMAGQLQTGSRRCVHHLHLGETQALYDTLREEQRRKNLSGELAWRMANEISQEDFQWVGLAYDDEESKTRMKVLEWVCPRHKIRWEMGPDREVVLTFPPVGMLTAHMEKLAARGLKTIQAACDDDFGPGRVVVVQAEPGPVPSRMEQLRRRLKG